MVELKPPPARPRTGGSTPHSLPSTPASGSRRQRQAVGFTNRSRPGTAVAPASGAEGEWARSTDERPRTSHGGFERERERRVVDAEREERGSWESARVPPRDDVFESQRFHAGEHAIRDIHTNMHGSMTRPGSRGKPLQRQVREKILKHCLNLGPVLRQHAGNGYISPRGMRAALASLPQLKLTDEELDLVGCADGPDNKIDVLQFLNSLKVPEFDEYDPLGKSKAREQLYLRNTVSSAPPRNFSRQYYRMPEAPVAVLEKAEKREESVGATSKKPKRKPGAGLARKYLRQVADEMDVKGLSLLDVFRKIDLDSSGAIDKGEFAQVIQELGIRGLGPSQTDFMFDHVDENTNEKIDLHELQTALLDSQIDRSQSSASGSRPSTFGPEDTGGNGPGPTPTPWSKSKQGTRIDSIVPQDHFNLRFRRSLMPPYATSETVVPIKTTFAYNPDHLRYSSVTLSNQWLTDGTGQGDIVNLRKEARIRRKRQTEARIAIAVQNREKTVIDMDQMRLGGLARTREVWLSSLAGPWA